MTRVTAWALQTRKGSYVNCPLASLAAFEAYRILTFRTRKQAVAWLANDRYWHNKATVVPVVITTKERGEP